MKTASPRRRGRHSATAIALAAALAIPATSLTGCSTTTAAPNRTGAAAVAAPNSDAGSARVVTLDGQTITVPRGKPAALFFFSVGCGECASQAKSLAQAAHTLDREAEFLAVDIDPTETAQQVTGFQQDVGARNIPAAIDTGAALAQRFGVAALSTLIVLDPAGHATYRGTDPAADQITAALRAAGAR